MALQTDDAIAASQKMSGLFLGHFVAECVYTVAVLGVADLLAPGPGTIEMLASATGCHASSLQRVLRILVSFGVFTEPEPGRFELTEVGATLRSDAPASLRDAAIFVMSPRLWTSLGALLDTLRNGAPAFARMHDATIYEWLARDPEMRSVFHRFMTSQSNGHNAAILDAYDFSDIRTIVDVGGGHGATLGAILRRYPKLKGVLFDLPEVVAAARLDTDLVGRCEVIGGDMLHSVPAGGDAYIIKRVFMDRRDNDVQSILCNCLAEMAEGGKILVIDPMLPSAVEPHPNWLVDIFGLAITGGQCRSEQEFRTLFDLVGLTLARVVPTRSPNFLLEGVRRVIA
jgi:hypothetical protein